MASKLFFSLLLVALLKSCHGVSIGASEPDELLSFFDGMERMMTGKAYVDDGFHEDLVQCLMKTDPKLYQSVNSQWAGIRAYANKGGAPGDIWYRCGQEEKPGKRYFEYNCTTQPYGSLPVWEPCNYVSNIAYYHLTLQLCNRSNWSMPQSSVNNIIKIYASLAAGSSSMHASMSTDGIAEDRRVNDLMSYAVYFEVIKALGSDSSIINELHEQPRSKPASGIVDDWMNMYITDPVEEWGPKLNSSDIASIGLSYCGFLTATFTVVFDNDQLVKDISLALLSLFGNMDNFDKQELLDVCINKFIPEFEAATEAWRPLPGAEREKIAKNVGGTLAKLLYAFVWQEHTFNSTTLLNPLLNDIGSALLGEFNTVVSNELESFEFNPAFESGKNLYPGQETCAWDPHAKWHLQSAIALLDFIYLADDIFQLLKSHQ